MGERSTRGRVMEILVDFLYNWQKDAIRKILEDNTPGKYYLIKSLRQNTGKTFTLLNLLGLIAITRPGSVSILLSPTFSQSQRCLEDLGNAYIDWVKVASKGNGIIDFCNGSRIYFKSGEQGNSLRGFTVKKGGILAVDEAVFISNEVFEIVLPVVNKKKATVVMTSTPDKMSGMFYDLYTKGLQNINSKLTSINWSDYIDEVYSKEDLEFYKEIYSERRFKTEILGEFVADGGSVFRNIDNCIGNDECTGELYFGIDWGSGNGKDYTVVTCLDSEKHMAFQKAVNDLAPMEQVRWINGLIRDWSPRRVLVEKNSIGSIYYDALVQENKNCVIETFNTTNESKCRIVDQLCAHFEKGKIQILDDEQLLEQLKGFQETSTKSGLRTYSCPLPLHDDRVMSLCFALEAVESCSGEYSLGYSSFHTKTPTGSKRLRNKYERK